VHRKLNTRLILIIAISEALTFGRDSGEYYKGDEEQNFQWNSESLFLRNGRDPTTMSEGEPHHRLLNFTGHVG
jgi:hypothetical protein